MAFESIPSIDLNAKEKPSIYSQEELWEMLESSLESKLRRARNQSRKHLYEGESKNDHPTLERDFVSHGKYSLDIIGISHDLETIAQHAEAIREAIREAQYVILESPAPTLVADKHYRNNIPAEKMIRPAQKTKRWRKFEFEPDRNYGEGGYFMDIAMEMAKTERKQVVSLDPMQDERLISSQHFAQYMEKERVLREDKSDMAEKLVKLGIANGVLSAAVLLHKPKTEVGISRRGFLAGASGTVAAGTIGAHSWLEHSDEQASPLLRYEGILDYRDICIASGVRHLENQATKPARVALIHGVNHSKGIKFYLEHPQLAELKYRMLYQGFSRVAPPQIRAYHFAMTPEEVRVDEAGYIYLESIGQWEKSLETTIKL